MFTHTEQRLCFFKRVQKIQNLEMKFDRPKLLNLNLLDFYFESVCKEKVLYNVKIAFSESILQ